MALEILYPELSRRDCKDCWLYLYDEETGNVKENWQGRLLRAPTVGPPCVASFRGCPVGHIDRPKRLTETGRAIYNHYLECRAVGQFPDDPLVRRHAMIIRSVEDAIERAERQSMMRHGPRG